MTTDSPPESGVTTPHVQTPSRAALRHQKRQAKRAARDAAQVREQALADVPAPFRSEKSVGPVLPGSSEPLPTQQERRLRSQEERDQIRDTGQLPRGRPSEYSQEEATAICQWIQAGGSLRAYSRQTGRTVDTVYRWMAENADFLGRYTAAHADRADTLAEEMLEIADDAAINPSLEGVAAARLRVESRKWIASKLNAKKWGDKQVVEHHGAVNIRIGINKPAPAATVLETVEEVKQLR